MKKIVIITLICVGIFTTAMQGMSKKRTLFNHVFLKKQSNLLTDAWKKQQFKTINKKLLHFSLPYYQNTEIAFDELGEKILVSSLLMQKLESVRGCYYREWNENSIFNAETFQELTNEKVKGFKSYHGTCSSGYSMMLSDEEYFRFCFRLAIEERKNKAHVFLVEHTLVPRPNRPNVFIADLGPFANIQQCIIDPIGSKILVLSKDCNLSLLKVELPKE